MNLQFTLADKLVMKDANWCQTLGKLIGVCFPDLNLNFLWHKQHHETWFKCLLWLYIYCDSSHIFNDVNLLELDEMLI